jgi:hypothetical protein
MPHFHNHIVHMPKIKVNTLKQCPYGYARKDERVDPTRQGVQKAIDEGRFSKKIMGHNYKEVQAEIWKKTQDPAEMDRLMHEYHNERVAELVQTQETWLDKPDSWPITVNQFNEIIEGNHRFRAIRFLGLDEVEVTIVQAASPSGYFQLPEIWA